MTGLLIRAAVVALMFAGCWLALLAPGRFAEPLGLALIAAALWLAYAAGAQP